MAIVVLLVGLALIGFRIWWRIGIVLKGCRLCQGKIIDIDAAGNQLTIEYTFKKNQYFHTFAYDSFPLSVKREGVKTAVWVDQNDPETIRNIVRGYYDYAALSRLSLLFGCIFTLAGALVLAGKS